MYERGRRGVRAREVGQSASVTVATQADYVIKDRVRGENMPRPNVRFAVAQQSKGETDESIKSLE